MNTQRGTALACPAPQSAAVVDLRFEEVPGALAFVDSSGRGTNATCTGATCPTAAVTGAPNAPLSDYAVQFDGADDLLTLNRTIRDDFTVALWLKLDATTISRGALLEGGASNADRFQFAVDQANTTNPRLRFQSQVSALQTGNILSRNQWTHVVATRQLNGATTLYVNGVPVAQSNLPAQPTGGATLAIGAGFKGAIDALQIYSTALSATTVQALYNRTMQSYCVVAGVPSSGNAFRWSRLTLREQDARGGRITANGGLSLIVDADLPTVSIDGLVNNRYMQGGNPVVLMIGGNASDTTAGIGRVEVNVNNSGWQAATGDEAWAYALVVTEGAYTIQARATDNANNQSAVSPAVTLIADATAPDLTLNALGSTPKAPQRINAGQWRVALGGTISDPVRAGRAGSGLPADAVQVLLESQFNQGLPNTWQTATINGNAWSLDYQLAGIADPSGSYTVTVRAMDNVGNRTPETRATLMLDATGPVATLRATNYAAGILSEVIDGPLTLSGQVTETGRSGINELLVGLTPISQAAVYTNVQLLLAFDELAGATFFIDDSGQGHHATCTSAPNCPTVEVGAIFPNARSFDSSQSLTMDNAPALNADAATGLSVQAWIATNYATPILQKGAANSGYGLSLNGSGQATWSLPGLILAGGPNLISSNAWRHIVGTVDRTTNTANLYVNGERVATAPFSGSLVTANPLLVGNNGSAGYRGLLDQVAVFQRTLSATEVSALYEARNRLLFYATLTPRGGGILTSNWTLSLPAWVPEGQYQIDLRTYDMLGHRGQVINVWRGVVDTQAPRVEMTAQPTGASYFDSSIGMQRNAVRYFCGAQDRHLDAAQFFCPGEAVAQPLSTFQNDPILQQLFPDFTIRSGLAVSYTLWERADASGAAVIASACDIYGHCAQSSGTMARAVAGKSEQVAVANAAVSSTPLAVVIAPTDLGYVAADAGSIQVTIAAEATAGLKDVTLLLDGNPVHTANFAQADNVQSNQTTVAVPVTGEGRHTLVARATDWAGGTQPTDYPVQFTLDTQAPTVTLDTIELTPADTWQMGSGVLRFRGTAGDTIGLAAVKVRVNDGMLTDAQFANGAWQIAYPVRDPEGQTLVVLVRAIDRAGRISEVSRSIPVNLNAANPPQTSFTSATPADPSNSPTVAFAFTGSAPAGLGGFECKIDEGAFVACSSPWPVSNLSKGAHIFQVCAIDANGFVDPSPADYSWTLNSIGPDATITSRPANPSTSRSAEFAFTGSPSFECSLGEATFTVCTSPQIYNSVTDGEHSFQVRGRSGDQTGTPDRWVWRVTNLSPMAQDQSVTTMQNVAIAITLNAIDEDTLTYQVVNAPAHGVLLGVPPTLTYQPDTNFSGADSFTFRANDGGAPPGPVSNLATVNMTVQPTVVNLPQTTITVQPTDPSSNADASFEFTGAGGSSSLAGFECNLDNAGFIPCTSPQSYTALANGSHTFSVRAMDSAGNVDATPAMYTWTVAVAPPDITAPTSSPTQLPVANAAGWNNSDVIVTWNWTDNSGGTGLDLANCVASSTSSGEGEIALTATCKDLAGNVGAASYTVKVDKSAPDTSITAQPSNPSASSDAQFEFTGSDATAGIAGFECSLDGGAFTPCTSPQNYSGLAAGSHSFQVHAIDVAGNLDPNSAAYGWTINPIPVDSTPPVITPQVNGTAGSNGWYVSDVTVTWNVTDAESTISTKAGCDTVTISADTGGTTLTCSATSSGGPASQSVTIKLDKTVPDTTISAQPVNPSPVAEATFVFAGNDNIGVASTECSLDGAAFAPCTSPQLYSSLANGNHTFQVRTVDTAGNIDATPAAYTWTITPPPPPAPTILIGSNENGKVGGLSYRDEDIIAYNPNTQQWSMVFDGSDVGLGDSEVDDFALLPGGIFLLSVEKDFTLKGFGPVGDEDLIQFTPTQLGDTTRGSFTLYLDGSTVELDAKNDNEDIKAVELDGSGQLVISTHGPFSAKGVKGENEDLFSLARTPTPVWIWRLDGGDIKLKPDLRALWIDTATDELYVVAEGSFSITGSNGKLSGDGNDIFICRQLSFGANSQCELRMFQDMGARGLGKQKIDGLAIGNVPVELFNISVQTSTIEDDTHEFPGDDADEPALPDSEESEEEQSEEEQSEDNNLIFLPLVAR